LSDSTSDAFPYPADCPTEGTPRAPEAFGYHFYCVWTQQSHDDASDACSTAPLTPVTMVTLIETWVTQPHAQAHAAQAQKVLIGSIEKA
jgi:hypothetical protein